MAEYVVGIRQGWAGRSNGTAGSMRRAFPRNHERSGRCCKKFLAGKSGDVVGGAAARPALSCISQNMRPTIIWVAEDLNERHLKSIEAWRAHTGLPTSVRRWRIDLTDPAWCPAMPTAAGRPNWARRVLRQCDPTSRVAGLRGPVAAQAAICAADGRLFLYGPFKREGKHTR